MIPAWPQPEMSTKPFIGVEHQRHVLGKVVLDHAAVLVPDLAFEVQFRSGWVRGTGPVSQAPGNNLGRPIDHHERAAQFLVFLLEQERLVGLLAFRPRPGQENPAPT